MRTDGMGGAVKPRAMVAVFFPAAVTNVMGIMTAALRLVCNIIEASDKGANDVLSESIRLDTRQLAHDTSVSTAWAIARTAP